MFKSRIRLSLMLAATLAVASFSAAATPTAASPIPAAVSPESSMSFSIGASASTKAVVMTTLAERFDEVLVHQPIHEIDRPAALAATQAYVDLVGESETKDIQIKLSGSIWSVDGDHRSVGVTISVGFVDRPAGTA